MPKCSVRAFRGPAHSASAFIKIEALRYRAEDVARGITRNVIKEARAKELKAELLNSTKLKEYFEEHAAERQLLRHDKPLHKTPQAAHLKHVPAYLKDPSIIHDRSEVGAGGRAAAAQAHAGRVAKRRKKGGVDGDDGSSDPLKGLSGFAKAAKRQDDDELTAMEKRAGKKGAKAAKKAAKLAGPAVVPKANVRKNVRVFKKRR
ncbi:hypothetical protein FOA52_012317 [Chlamydomonas sp. UWO 241]|nr:hypothetical protein FOA52_012317 [Chlamydomonas sp. UWO 241]